MRDMPLPPLHVPSDVLIEDYADARQLPSNDAERPFGDLLRPVVGGVLEPIALQPLDVAETVQGESPHLPMGLRPAM